VSWAERQKSREEKDEPVGESAALLLGAGVFDERRWEGAVHHLGKIEISSCLERSKEGPTSACSTV
jgi:hypothetical protein